MCAGRGAGVVTVCPARTAKLATVRADGRPHIAPVWFDLDHDGTVVFMMGRIPPRDELCVAFPPWRSASTTRPLPSPT